jgi:hypothetical protein
MSTAAVVQQVAERVETAQPVDVEALQNSAVELAEAYHGAGERVKVTIAERRATRQRLIPILHAIKAELVGRGCEGQWKPFCVGQLKMSVRTIDNWLSGVTSGSKKEASKLPASAVEEQPEPTNRQELLERTIQPMRAVFQPLLARDREAFLRELRLYFQTATNDLVGDLDGFTVEFTNLSPDFLSEKPTNEGKLR